MSSGQLGAVLQHIRQLLAPRPAGETTDRQLLERFVATRDHGAFAALVHRHGSMVWGVCQRILGDAHAAEDAFQATFLVLTRRAGDVRWQESIGNWLHGVACRVAGKARAQTGRRTSRETAMPSSSANDVIGLPEPSSAEAGPLSEAARRELRAILDEEVLRLPEKYRAPVVLCYLEGKTNEEAAAQLCWPVGSVKIRLTRARDLLRGRLAQRGLAFSAAALGTAIPESAAAAVPAALLNSTIEAAVSGAAGASAAPAVLLAEGVINAMLWTRIKLVTAAVLLLSIGTSATVLAFRAGADKQPPGPVAAAPGTETTPPERGVTDPPGLPLEVRLVVKKRTYVLDYGHRTPEDYATAVQTEPYPLAPEVDLVLEVRNAGKEPVRLGSGGAGLGLHLKLEGPGAVSLKSGNIAILGPPPAPVHTTLNPGETHRVPIQRLEYHNRKSSSTDYYRAYWTRPGAYTLTARLETTLNPAPKGAEPAGSFLGDKDTGLITLTADPVPLQVTELRPEERGKTDPPGVPLEVRLVAKKTTYDLDLGGKSREEFERPLREPGALLGTPAAPPRVDVVLEIQNTGTREQALWVGGDSVSGQFVLNGPGAWVRDIEAPTTGDYRPPTSLKLAPGQRYAVPVTSLAGGVRGISQGAWWSRPGTYKLAVRFHTAVSPAPEGNKANNDGFGRVTLISAPIQLEVTDIKPEERGRTDPPGAPLELKIVAKKLAYPLDFGGKTEAEYRKALETETWLEPPAVDLALEVRNTGTKDLEVYTGLRTDGCLPSIDLKGPGAVVLQQRSVAKDHWGQTISKLAPGQSILIPLKTLETSGQHRWHRGYWTKPGEYTLSARLETRYTTAPAGDKDRIFDPITLISAPIKLQIAARP